MSCLGAILLAAGGSSRMGSPKQLLQVSGETLLRRAARAALDAGADPVIVVLGHAAEACRESVEDLPVRPVVNEEWREGQGSSLRCGVAALLANKPDCPAVLVLLTDQVQVTAEVIRRLSVAFHKRGKGIAVSRYGEVLGPPAIFHARYFPQLAALQGDRGARSIIAEAAEEVAVVDFPEGAIDLDTPADFQRWLEHDTAAQRSGGGDRP